MRPRTGTAREEAVYREAEHRSVVACAISGCIESPVQIIFQMWLVLNGVVRLDFSEDKSVSITDLQGNTLMMPFTASVCILFSILALVKVLHIDCYGWIRVLMSVSHLRQA